ncbi:MAG: exosome complex RNA-binding protein Csl4 [Candidatus Bathyarchaeia archaeon]
MTARMKLGQLVVPGERLGVTEEFAPGPGTFEQGGTIYSKRIGVTKLDRKDRSLRVEPVSDKPTVPSVGDVVIGRVAATQEKAAIVDIVKVGEKPLVVPFQGVLHISTIGPTYVRNVQEAFRPLDLIRARVTSTMNSTYHLSTVDRDLGVLLAFCSKCGHVLRRERAFLRCDNCGAVERRKTASDYSGEHKER